MSEDRRCELCACCPRCCVCEYGRFEDGVPYCRCDDTPGGAMSAGPKLCHCGKPLHYSNPHMQELIEALVARLGETVIVTASSGRRWKVPRHYIALHGLKDAEVAQLGFEEVKPEPAKAIDPLEFPCPSCMAPPGIPCHRDGRGLNGDPGTAMLYFHRSRVGRSRRS